MGSFHRRPGAHHRRGGDLALSRSDDPRRCEWGYGLSANPHPTELRYVVVWRDSVERHETYIRERPLADAYAAKHHGIVVTLVNLSAWPEKPFSRSQENGSSPQLSTPG